MPRKNDTLIVQLWQSTHTPSSNDATKRTNRFFVEEQVDYYMIPPIHKQRYFLLHQDRLCIDVLEELDEVTIQQEMNICPYLYAVKMKDYTDEFAYTHGYMTMKEMKRSACKPTIIVGASAHDEIVFASDGFIRHSHVISKDYYALDAINSMKIHAVVGVDEQICGGHYMIVFDEVHDGFMTQQALLVNYEELSQLMEKMCGLHATSYMHMVDNLFPRADIKILI